MMRRLFLLLFFCFCAGAADEWCAFTPYGFRVGPHSFTLTAWNNGWKGSILSAKTTQADPGFPKKTADGIEYRGIYHLPLRSFRLSVTGKQTSADAAEYRMTFSADPALRMDGIAFGCVIRRELWDRQPYQIDGRKVVLKKGEKVRNLGPVRRIQFPTREGVVVLEGTFQATLHDLSHTSYAPDSLNLRLNPVPQNGMIRQTGFAFQFRRRAFDAETLDLRSAMNMGFRDEQPNDRKGGWTDQGGTNDLSAMTPGKKICANVPFQVVDPETNRGKSCIVLRGADRLYFPVRAEKTFETPVKGTYLYVLHALAWPKEGKIGEIRCSFDDGSGQTIPVIGGEDVGNFWKPYPLSRGSVGWHGQNDLSAVGLYVTRFRLERSGVKKIVFESAGKSVWMIVGASLSDFEIRPKQDEKVVMKASSEWIPMKGKRRIRKGSILDFSFQLDAPAGKYGFARNRGGQIVFEKRPDQPVRFYGANVCFSANYMDHELSDRLAEEFQTIGYNLIRLHHFDRDTVDRSDGKSTRMKAEFKDRMDYLIAACRKRGIYVTLDLFISRNLEKDEIREFPGEKVDRTRFKGLVFVSDDAMRNWQEYAKNLLTAVNPYTGLAWKDDPAIISLDLINENAIFWTSQVNGTKALYETKFNAWLKSRGIQPTFLERRRFRTLFLQEVYPAGYAKMRDFLRSIGVRQMLADQNHNSNIITMLLREPYDLVENHFYWAHPVFLKGWGLPALVVNDSSISKGAGALNTMFQTRAFGKPFLITEWDYTNTNPYNVEGAFLTGAYASLQDWSALCRFAYSHDASLFRKEESRQEFFDIANDPVRLLSERAGNLFFLRGDIRPSDLAVPLLLNWRHFESPDSSDECGIVPQRMGLVAKTGNVIFSPGERPALPAGTVAAISTDAAGENVALNVPVVASTDHLHAFETLEKAGAIPKKSFEPSTGTFVSSTGELTLTMKKNQFRALSSRSEGFLLEGGQVLTGRFAEVRNLRTFCGILVASYDKVPLTKSERYLILHLTETKSSGMTFRNPEMRIWETSGGLPLLLRRGEAEITLKRDCSGFRLYAVDFDGSRKNEIPFTVRNGCTVFRVDSAGKQGAVAAYELVREKPDRK